MILNWKIRKNGANKSRCIKEFCNIIKQRDTMQSVSEWCQNYISHLMSSLYEDKVEQK